LLLDRGKSIEKLMKESEKVLKSIHEEHGHSSEYLKNQWIRQRECQLSQMAAEAPKDVEDQLEELVELEDKLRDAQ
jgi:gas vesicle protein